MPKGTPPGRKSTDAMIKRTNDRFKKRDERRAALKNFGDERRAVFIESAGGHANKSLRKSMKEVRADPGVGMYKKGGKVTKGR